MSPWPSSSSAPFWSSTMRLSILLGDAERDLARHVRLDQARHDRRLRTLRREDQVDADGAGLLREADDERLDFLAAGHHQVGQLVD